MGIDTDRIRYRKATVNDVESLVSLRIRFLDELYSHQDNEATDVLRESMRKFFSKAIPSHDFVAWVAECEGRIIGMSGMVIWRRPPNYRGLESGKLGYVLNFYTIPQARRKGIATHLLTELLKEAKSLELRFLHLNATKDGMNIYRKFGFEEPDDPELVLRL